MRQIATRIITTLCELVDLKLEKQASTNYLRGTFTSSVASVYENKSREHAAASSVERNWISGRREKKYLLIASALDCKDNRWWCLHLAFLISNLPQPGSSVNRHN